MAKTKSEFYKQPPRAYARLMQEHFTPEAALKAANAGYQHAAAAAQKAWWHDVIRALNPPPPEPPKPVLVKFAVHSYGYQDYRISVFPQSFADRERASAIVDQLNSLGISAKG